MLADVAFVCMALTRNQGPVNKHVYRVALFRQVEFGESMSQFVLIVSPLARPSPRPCFVEKYHYRQLWLLSEKMSSERIFASISNLIFDINLTMKKILKINVVWRLLADLDTALIFGIPLKLLNRLNWNNICTWIHCVVRSTYCGLSVISSMSNAWYTLLYLRGYICLATTISPQLITHTLAKCNIAYCILS